MVTRLGGCLALEATVKLGDKVKRLAIYEAPYNDDPEAQKAWGEYIKSLTEALASDRREDAVALFMAYVRMPAAQIEGMGHAPFWGGMEAIAPTLAYDHTVIMGKDGAIPTERAARVRVPTLVMSGGNGAPFMLETAKTLTKAIPVARLRTLDGQTHDVHPDALARSWWNSSLLDRPTPCVDGSQGIWWTKAVARSKLRATSRS